MFKVFLSATIQEKTAEDRIVSKTLNFGQINLNETIFLVFFFFIGVITLDFSKRNFVFFSSTFNFSTYCYYTFHYEF